MSSWSRGNRLFAQMLREELIKAFVPKPHYRRKQLTRKERQAQIELKANRERQHHGR